MDTDGEVVASGGRAMRWRAGWGVVTAILAGFGAGWAVEALKPPVGCGDPVHEILLDKVAEQAMSFMARAPTRQPPADLWALVRSDQLHVDQLFDPWGTPLRYTCAGRSFEVCSAGADRRFGSRDDACRRDGYGPLRTE